MKDKNLNQEQLNLVYSGVENADLTAKEAVKKDEGKAALSKIFEWLDTHFLLELADVLKFGAKKYEANQWKLGISDESRLTDAILRHLQKYMKGELVDSESGLSHLSHATASLMFLHFYERMRSEPVYLCSGCSRELPKSEFGENASQARGVQYRCYSCRASMFPRRKVVILEDHAVFELQNGKGTLVDTDVALEFLKLNARLRIDVGGYATYLDRQKATKLHHFVIGKPPEGMEVDHINRDPLDNRRQNLRFVTSKENRKNQSAKDREGCLYIQLAGNIGREPYYKAYTYYNNVKTNLASGKDRENVLYQGKLKLMEMNNE